MKCLIFVLCKIKLELMKANGVFKYLEILTASLEAAIEDDLESMIIISYGIICPLIAEIQVRSV